MLLQNDYLTNLHLACQSLILHIIFWWLSLTWVITHGLLYSSFASIDRHFPSFPVNVTSTFRHFASLPVILRQSPSDGKWPEKTGSDGKWWGLEIQNSKFKIQNQFYLPISFLSFFSMGVHISSLVFEFIFLIWLLGGGRFGIMIFTCNLRFATFYTCLRNFI